MTAKKPRLSFLDRYLTIRIFSSAENLRRVLRRMSRTAASLDCFFLLGMGHSSAGLSPSAKCLLTQSHLVSEFS
jgi:hypothetical protein